VTEILSKKYGDRLKDMFAARRSKNLLYGDMLSAPRMIDEARDRLWPKYW
jgi:hypothetical protein